VNCRKLAISQSIDVTDWGLTEESTVLATELTYALVTNFVRRGRSVHSIH